MAAPAFRPVKLVGKIAELSSMESSAGLLSRIDAIFPYFCFFYGAVTSFVLNSELCNRLADERLPVDLVARWRSHRALALVSLFGGALWILQNLWLT